MVVKYSLLSSLLLFETFSSLPVRLENFYPFRTRPHGLEYQYFNMSLSVHPQQLKEPDTREIAASSCSSFSTQSEKQSPDVSSDSSDLESQSSLSTPVYHVFSQSQKLRMVYTVSLAAIFSPLSSNIYFPALALISKVSETLVHRG